MHGLSGVRDYLDMLERHFRECLHEGSDSDLRTVPPHFHFFVPSTSGFVTIPVPEIFCVDVSVRALANVDVFDSTILVSTAMSILQGISLAALFIASVRSEPGQVRGDDLPKETAGVVAVAGPAPTPAPDFHPDLLKRAKADTCGFVDGIKCRARIQSIQGPHLGLPNG